MGRSSYDPLVIEAAGLVLEHQWSLLAAKRVTGCSYGKLQQYMRDQGVTLTRGRRGGVFQDHQGQLRVALLLRCVGWTMQDISQVVGADRNVIRTWFHNCGMTVINPGISPVIDNTDLPSCGGRDLLDISYQAGTAKVGRGRRLTGFDRVYIRFCLDTGVTITQIAARLGRDKSVISREINRHISPTGVYDPYAAQAQAMRNLARPKQRKIVSNTRLRRMVRRLLNRHISPVRIVARLKRMFGDNADMTLSHETIYQALYVQGAGALRHELTVDYALKSRRKGRKPRSKLPTRGRGAKPWVEGAEYSTRPEGSTQRLPGHWEGDLVISSDHKAAIVTLIDRHSRFFMARLLPTDHTSATVVTALKDMLATINHMATQPEHKIQSLTWDQGTEMALSNQLHDHHNDLKLVFCDPHSPWQRPSNENINGELRRFLPKGTNFSELTHQRIQEIEDIINDTPRVCLDGLTPREVIFNIDPTTDVAFTD